VPGGGRRLCPLAATVSAQWRPPDVPGWFGCLFGVMNFAGFEPVAAERGLPADVAPQTAELAARWRYFSPTWTSWAEIAAVDWNEPAVRPDGAWRPVWSVVQTLAALHGPTSPTPRSVASCRSRSTSTRTSQSSRPPTAPRPFSAPRELRLLASGAPR
jgi:hypothetical protein